jgi:hypothetical protein
LRLLEAEWQAMRAGLDRLVSEGLYDQGMRVAADRWKRKTVGRAFYAWRGVAGQREERVAQYIAHLQRLSLARGVRSWHGFAVAARTKEASRRVVVRCVVAMQQRLVRSCVNTWVGYMDSRKKARRLIKFALLRYR